MTSASSPYPPSALLPCGLSAAAAAGMLGNASSNAAAFLLGEASSSDNYSSAVSSTSTSNGGSSDDSKGKIMIAFAIVRLILAVFGCATNIIAAVVLTNRKLWSPTSMLLLSLVIYDAFYLVLFIPLSVASISANVHYTPARYSTFLTILAMCFPLRTMAQMASTYTTLTVTIERYLVILLPLKASAMWTYGRTRSAIIGVLLFSVIFNIPRCFDQILSSSSTTTNSNSQTASTSSSSSSSPTTTTLSSSLGAAGTSSASSPPSSSLSSPGSSVGVGVGVGSVLKLNLSSTPSWGDRGTARDGGVYGTERQPALRPHNNARSGSRNSVSPGTGTGKLNCSDMRRGDLPPGTLRDGKMEKTGTGGGGGSGVGGASGAGGGGGGEATGVPIDDASGDDGGGGDNGDGGGVVVSDGILRFYKEVYLFWLTVIVLYLIPYTMIPVLNLLLVMALRRRKEETRRISVKNEHRINGVVGAPSPTDKEDGLTYIVFGITLCYFICCILPIAYVLSTIASDNSNIQTSIFLLNAGETTLVINASTDFFFYCLLGRKFRRVFMRTFCPKRYLKKTKAMTLRSTDCQDSRRSGERTSRHSASSSWNYSRSHSRDAEQYSFLSEES